jgi:uncharacterized glyoxalase superfamily protein PhnB
MTQNQEEHTPVIYPVLSYRDAAAAMAWLERAFGFKKVIEVPTPDGGIAHAEMSFGDGMIMLATAKDVNGWKSPLDLPAVNQTVYVYVGDVDTHYQRAKAAHATIVRELADTEYGSREYSALDLEGHHWSFGTYHPVPSATT